MLRGTVDGTMFDGLLVGILVIDRDGIAAYANARLSEMLGVPVDRLVGEPLLSSVLPADHATVMEHLRARRAGESDSYDVRLTTADGGVLHTRVHASPLVRDGAVVGSVAAITDLTDLATVAADRDDALREARAAVVAHTRLLSWASHELRTPLSTISGFAQLLRSSLPDGEEHDMAERIFAASNHVNSLVRDLIDYARADADVLEPTLTAVPLRAVVGDALELVSGVARDLDVHIEISVGDEQVLAARRHLVQALLNLLSNAVKYGGRGSTVAVTSAVVGDRIRCTIADHGPGIPADLQRRAFRPFERLDNAAEVPGVGLGLSIADSFVRAMNGALTLTSPPGGGAAFTIDLARAFPAEVDGPPTSDAAPATTRLVLYVEDEPLNASLMESIVSLLPGRTLQIEPTVAAGVRTAAEQRPALILLDLHLPDGSGYEVLRAVRADPATAVTPVFVLSADATEGAERHAQDLGADRYITKPFNISEFVALVDSVT